MVVRRSHAERQRDAEERLTNAFAELIAEQGYERTTAVQIGERAGYSRAAVRDRYGSKEGLLDALHQRYERLLLGDDPTSAATSLNEFFARLGQFGAERPAWLRAIFIVSFESAGASEAFTPTLQRWMRMLHHEGMRLVELEQAAGTVRADVDAATFVPMAVDTLVGAAFRWCVFGEEAGGAAGLVQRAAELLADLRPSERRRLNRQPRLRPVAGGSPRQAGGGTCRSRQTRG